jgi:hypothetical protein
MDYGLAYLDIPPWRNQDGNMFGEPLNNLFTKSIFMDL